MTSDMMFPLVKGGIMTITDYMRNIAFINLIEISDSCRNRIFNDTTVSQAVLNYAENLKDIVRIIPVALSIDQIKLFYDDKTPEYFILLEENTEKNLLTKLSDACENFDHCFYFYGDTPLLDTTLTTRMVENHYKYFADYTFADGYPYGLTPEILNRHCLSQLIPLALDSSDPVVRDSLFKILQKDINAFDIETEISSVDMRLKRLSLCSDTLINWMQLDRIVKAGGKDAESILAMNDTIEKYTRTLPSYIQIQIAEKCWQSCSYCPYPEIAPHHRESDVHMSVEQVLDLARKIDRFSPGCRISLSLWGDPSAHPDISGILEGILRSTSLKIVIETSGLGWENLLDTRKDLIKSDRIDWIFSLDSVNPRLYKSLRGEGQESVLKTIEGFMKLNSLHTWIQAVRMNENEEDLELFFRSWKEKTENVIIQKYDHFSLFLDQRKVTDLSPVNRFPCWHLKREMSILTDGSVVLCREDIEKKNVLGNVFQQNLQEIWDSAESLFDSHINSVYKGICSNCDEYYTYNF